MEFTTEQNRLLEEVFKNDGTVDEACAVAGLYDEDILEWFLLKDAEGVTNARKIKNWKQLPLYEARKKAVVGATETVKDAQWYLEKKLPKEFGNKITTEHTGADGGPIQLSNATDPRVEELARKYEAELKLLYQAGTLPETL